MPTQEDGAPRDDGGRLPERRILVVEDHPVNQLVALGMLRQLGYEAVAVGDGIKAVEATARERFVAVLMDCRMPVLDGYDAARMIRAREAQEAGPRLPLIALTASVGREDRERARAAGMDAFVTKPVSMDKLEEALRACLQERSRDLTHDPGGGPGQREGVDSGLPCGFLRLAELEQVVGPQGMREIYHVFFADSDRILRLLHAALTDGDFSAFGNHAHGLKGSCANVGAESLGELAMELEMRAREGRLDGARPLLKRFRAELDAARMRGSA